MDFGLSEQQQILQKSARDFLTNRSTKTVVRAMEKDGLGYSPELWKEMAQLGWMGLAFPEKYGGSGMSFLDLSVLLEEIGRSCYQSPFLTTVVIAGLAILDAGSESQKADYLPKIAEGKAILSLAVIESSGKLSSSSIATRATRDRDGFTINGTKVFVPWGHVAGYFLCLAAGPESGTTLFLVDSRSPGIACTPLSALDNDKQCEVIFENVCVPTENILGQPGTAWPHISKAMQRAAVATCVGMVGGMQQVLEMTVSYAKDRKQFGRPIGSFQTIQHYCANMATDVDGSRLASYEAAWRLSEDLPCNKEVAVAKAWTGEAYKRVTSLSHQIHGAIGFTDDYDLQFYTRRAKVAELSFGDPDSCREVVAQEMGL